MCALGLAADPEEEKANQGRGNTQTARRERILGRVNGVGWRCCRRSGQGQVAKGLEYQGSRAAWGGPLVKEEEVGVRKMWIVVKSMDSGLRQPGFKSHLRDLGQVTYSQCLSLLASKMEMLLAANCLKGLLRVKVS